MPSSVSSSNTNSYLISSIVLAESARPVAAEVLTSTVASLNWSHYQQALGLCSAFTATVFTARASKAYINHHQQKAVVELGPTVASLVCLPVAVMSTHSENYDTWLVSLVSKATATFFLIALSLGAAKACYDYFVLPAIPPAAALAPPLSRPARPPIASDDCQQ